MLGIEVDHGLLVDSLVGAGYRVYGLRFDNLGDEARAEIAEIAANPSARAR